MRLEGWRRLKERASRRDLAGGSLLVGLDFDGTLAEIADAPDQARIAPESRRLLRILLRRRDTRVAVLSGRALRDVRRLVGLRGIFYGGNHGLEVRGPGLSWRHPRAAALGRSRLRIIERGLRSFPEAFVENKGLGASVHYRGVPSRRAPRLRTLVRSLARNLGAGWRLSGGKMNLDIRPKVAWDKGRALELIRRALPAGRRWGMVFVGDDATDEEAFRRIGGRALTVRVGRTERTAARYALRLRRSVDALLGVLARRPGALGDRP